MSSQGVLYIVATPIGNLDDISLRALAVLKRVDVVAAEDTRHSQKLLQHFAIEQRLIPYHDHSSEKHAHQLLQMLEAGKQVALISDAGTPLISDPGYRLVRLAREQGVRVSPVPGASAVLSALSAAGLPTDRFRFEGFLPAKSAARRKHFEALKNQPQTVVCFESPHRIRGSLEDALDILGADREAVLARELTKTFETFLGHTLGEIRDAVEQDEHQRKGEMVLMLRGAAQQKHFDGNVDVEAERVLNILLAELSTKQASTLASQITGVPKKVLYQRATELKSI